VDLDWGALHIAALLNFFIGAVAIIWGLGRSRQLTGVPVCKLASVIADRKTKVACYAILFLTGFATMSMEVVWTRAFAKCLLPLVYSFALLLTFYLTATAIGARFYRGDVGKNLIKSKEHLLKWCALFVFLPIVLTDPRWPLAPLLIALV
jgi:hypothetical protein